MKQPPRCSRVKAWWKEPINTSTWAFFHSWGSEWRGLWHVLERSSTLTSTKSWCGPWSKPEETRRLFLPLPLKWWSNQVPELLWEICDELWQNNALLQTLKPSLVADAPVLNDQQKLQSKQSLFWYGSLFQKEICSTMEPATTPRAMSSRSCSKRSRIKFFSAHFHQA